MKQSPPAHKSGTAGQIVNPVESNIKTLAEYIQQKEKQYIEEERAGLTDYQKGYQDGYYDAIVQGGSK